MTQVPQDATSTPTKADPAGAPTPDAVAGNDTGSVSGEDAKSIVSKNFSIVGDLTCQVDGIAMADRLAHAGACLMPGNVHSLLLHPVRIDL